MSWYENDYVKRWLVVDSGTLLRKGGGGTTSDERDARAKAVLFAFKDRLTMAGVGAWTVLASSGKNGGGSLVASTSDNWLTEEDVVYGANSGADRSWVLLQSPNGKGGTFYLLLDYYGSVTNNAEFTFTKSQPNIASPAINARPPATGDEWVHSNSTFVKAAANYRRITQLTMVRADDGSFSCGMVTPLADIVDGEQHFSTLFMFNVLANTPSWDTVKAASLLRVSDVPIWYESQIDFQSLHSDASQVNLAVVYLSTYVHAFPECSHTNPWTNTYVATPVWLMSRDASKVCWRGNLEDIFWLPAMISDGMILFKNQLPKALKVGPFSMPMTERAGMI